MDIQSVSSIREGIVHGSWVFSVNRLNVMEQKVTFNRRIAVMLQNIYIYIYIYFFFSTPIRKRLYFHNTMGFKNFIKTSKQFFSTDVNM